MEQEKDIDSLQAIRVRYIFKPYAVIDDKEYYRIGAVAKAIGKTTQILRLWELWSDELESQGKPRLIPKSSRIGQNRIRCWTMEEIEAIVVFSRKIRYGDIAEFSRTRWGKRKDSLKVDKSTKARKEKKRLKKLQELEKKRQIIREYKMKKQEMFKFVRTKANKLYNETYKN